MIYDDNDDDNNWFSICRACLFYRFFDDFSLRVLATKTAVEVEYYTCIAN